MYTAIYFVITIALSMTGMTWMPVIFSIITGLLAELIYRRGRYESVRSAVLTSGVFSLWACGNYLPLFLQRDEYFASRTGYGQEYVETVMRYTPDWMFFSMLLSTFICGILGGLLGKALLKKHFRRGGIA